MNTRSPHAADPLGVRGEVGERVCDAPNATRSLHLTWAEFCASYRPGEYGRYVTPNGLARDADVLEHLLDRALSTLVHGVLLPRPIRNNSLVEETSCGSCYGTAA